MTPERWKRTEELYHAASALPPAARAAFLDEACGEDEELRRDLESLLRESASGDGFLAAPALPLSALTESDRPPSFMGRSLGGYQLESLLGAGGMGEVYRARDLTLGRDVAIKILPGAFTSDPDRLARFEREARILAALNHPNICAIYGLEEADGVRFLVLELLQGETLAQAIARGAGLLLPDALTAARQIAEALEAAHEKGIIHRDLKPANITITADGVVKVLDFGLAKSVAGAGAASDLTQAMEITSHGARGAVILGTAAYMSPEQARGRPVDVRTDVWAFGCVLYEMLTGRVAFKGETVSDTIAKILEREPEWTVLSDEIPTGIRTLLSRCLRKDPRQRLQAMGDARIEIEEIERGPRGESDGQHRLSWRERALWLTAVSALILIATAALIPGVRPIADLPETRLEITTPATTDPASLAMSPDGQKIVFSAPSPEGRPQLWLRFLNHVSARPLPSTDAARYPFWSPDSQSVAFFANGRLKRVDTESGVVREIANAPLGLGGTWNSTDTIVFSPNWVGPLLRISASGGEPVAVTRLSAGQSGHRFPQFLPDGRHFLFQSIESGAVFGAIYLSDIEGTQTRSLVESGAGATYVPAGYLLFAQGRPAAATLLAQHFNRDRLTLEGNPIVVAEGITVGLDPGSAALSASAAGIIAYRSDPGLGQAHLVWFDRSGNEIGKLGDPDSASSLNPSLSADGRRVALRRSGGENTDIWLLDTRTGLLSRLTTSGGLHNYPVWSPDNRLVAFTANPSRAGFNDLYAKLADGTGGEELLLSTSQNKALSDWSPDGRFLLFRSVDAKTGNDIWALSLPDRHPFPVLQTEFEERDAQFSPDGKWIAYQSNETGSFEVWARPFPGPGDRIRVSNNGGAQVRWRRDGRELFYIALDGRLMAVPIQFGSEGQTLESGSPVPLFATRIGGAFQGNNRHQYMVAPDGQRFLMNTVRAEANAIITVIQNWKPRPN